MENVKRWLPVLLYAAIIFKLSSTPGDDVPNWIDGWDKVIHACEYAGFGFLLARAFGSRRWWWAIVAGTLWGVSDEFHQTFVPHRSGNDLGDLTADFVGVTVGALAWQFVATRLLRRWRADGTKSP